MSAEAYTTAELRRFTEIAGPNYDRRIAATLLEMKSSLAVWEHTHGNAAVPGLAELEADIERLEAEQTAAASMSIWHTQRENALDKGVAQLGANADRLGARIQSLEDVAHTDLSPWHLERLDKAEAQITRIIEAVPQAGDKQPAPSPRYLWQENRPECYVCCASDTMTCPRCAADYCTDHRPEHAAECWR